MIVSATPGRVRFRSNGYRGSSISQSIASQLNQKKGINKVTVNNNSGSVLVEYDASEYSTDQITDLIREALSIPAIHRSTSHSPKTGRFLAGFSLGGKQPGKAMRSSLNSGLIATLVVSMMAIMGKNKKLHTQAGLAFLALVAKHALDNRNRIFR